MKFKSLFKKSTILEEKYGKIIFSSILLLITMSGLWAIDIGASAMTTEAQIGLPMVTQGLAFTRSPNTQYHVGLGLVIVSFIILLFLYTKEVMYSNVHNSKSKK